MDLKEENRNTSSIPDVFEREKVGKEFDTSYSVQVAEDQREREKEEHSRC